MKRKYGKSFPFKVSFNYEFKVESNRIEKKMRIPQKDTAPHNSGIN